MNLKVFLQFNLFSSLSSQQIASYIIQSLLNIKTESNQSLNSILLPINLPPHLSPIQIQFNFPDSTSYLSPPMFLYMFLTSGHCYFTPFLSPLHHFTPGYTRLHNFTPGYTTLHQVTPVYTILTLFFTLIYNILLYLTTHYLH